jgi:Protein of unknown function (DUF2652)
MAESRALLLIADIGGFTKYMTLHRIGAAHAQANIHRLLDAVIDAAPDLELIEIEGDAAFFATSAGDDSTAARQARDVAVAMHGAFHATRQRIVNNLCPCEGCAQAAGLRLKCVAHVGEVSERTIRDRKSLAGVPVILVHRLLKNSVPVPEYALLSEDLYAGGAAGEAPAVDQELEGLGPVRAYFFELREPEGEGAGLGARLGETVTTLGRGMPYLLGLKRMQADAH